MLRMRFICLFYAFGKGKNALVLNLNLASKYRLCIDIRRLIVVVYRLSLYAASTMLCYHPTHHITYRFNLRRRLIVLAIWTFSLTC